MMNDNSIFNKLMNKNTFLKLMMVFFPVGIFFSFAEDCESSGLISQIKLGFTAVCLCLCGARRRRRGVYTAMGWSATGNVVAVHGEGGPSRRNAWEGVVGEGEVNGRSDAWLTTTAAKPKPTNNQTGFVVCPRGDNHRNGQKPRTL